MLSPLIFWYILLKHSHGKYTALKAVAPTESSRQISHVVTALNTFPLQGAADVLRLCLQPTLFITTLLGRVPFPKMVQNIIFNVLQQPQNSLQA